jgi:hypothetical protein
VLSDKKPGLGGRRPNCGSRSEGNIR